MLKLSFSSLLGFIVILIFSHSTFAQLTWADDAAEIVFENCTACHNDNGIAPFSLMDYESVLSNSGAIEGDGAEDDLSPQERSAKKKFEEKWDMRKSELAEEIHIMNHLKQLSDEKLLSESEYSNFLSKYDEDEDFCDRVHTIYEVYETNEEVHDNQQRILFF